MKTRFLRDREGKIFKNYVIAEDGSYIRDKRDGKIIDNIYIYQGYRVVSIILNGKKYNQIKICHLQWLAWKGIIPKGYIIHHKEFSNDKKKNIKLKLNDHINNLDCITKFKHMSFHKSGENNHMFGKHPSEETRKKQSIAHVGKYPSIETRRKMSISKSGENHPVSKLTIKDVKEIRYLSYVRKWIQPRIAAKFRVSRGCVNHVLQGHTWNAKKLSKGDLFLEYPE
jgi:hypothetical protein